MDQQEEVYSKPFEYTLSLVGGNLFSYLHTH
jgi:hypothetical protein